jgi:sulfatase modifying factor 1
LQMPPGLTSVEFVTVGNPGNAPDTRYNNVAIGSVDHVYRMGKYEVTAAQYTEFLNAVAKADPNGLYNTSMEDPTGFRGANIVRSGSLPNYSYSVAADWANRPVDYVSFWDAARFANWLQNGQPTGPQGPGTTEDGAYINIGDQATFARQAGAKFFIPTDDEWYKAAYHNKSAGLAASYFDFPTGTNSVPGIDISETTNPANNANYYNGNYAIGLPYFRTNVGEFELSASPYGTFDQAGNVFEWDETIALTNYRILRGGSFSFGSFDFQASRGGLDGPLDENYGVGFRIASAIPEPSTAVLAFIACGLMCCLKRTSVLTRTGPA